MLLRNAPLALRLIPLASLLILLVVPPSFARDDEEPEWGRRETDALVELAREYAELDLKGSTRAARDEILAKADELGTVSDRRLKEVVKALFKVAKSGPKTKGKGECFAQFEDFPGQYFVSGGGGGKKGIFIGLHGGGPGVGSGRTAQSLWGAATGKGLIGVFPTANLPNRATTWQSPEVERCVLAIIRELKRTFRIDTNRIYVGGHSLGGSGAYHIGLRNADMLAAVTANAGGMHGNLDPRSGVSEITGGFVANLYNTPIFMTHFDKDPRVGVEDARAVDRELKLMKEEHPKGYEHVYIEGQGVDHGFPKGGSPAKIISWMAKKKRDPYPEKLVWEPASEHKTFFSWLRHGSPLNSRSRASRIVATCRKNRIEIESINLFGVSVMLGDEMIDPKRPVTVVVNGETRFSRILLRRPAALLESIVENIDPEQVFAYRIDLTE
jgi:dienelactone hydrolase